MRSLRLGLVLGLPLLLACACGTGRREGAEARDAGSAPAPAPSPPELDPGVLDQVSAVAVGERALYVGGEAGVVRLDPRTGAYHLLPEAAGLSSAGVSALALAPDGTLWSAHRSDPVGAGASRGGVRSFAPGEGEPRAWVASDGLGVADVSALAVSAERVVVGVGEALAELRLDRPDEGFVRRFEETNRKLQVVSFDEDGPSRRRVIEFRPRGERVLALALAEPLLWVGTTHGLYRLRGDEVLRFEIPCRVDGYPPRRVTALTATPGGIVAVLGLDGDDGQWRPGGVLELEGEVDWRCHVPDVDVPDSTSLAVAHAGGVTWLATYEGPTRIAGDEAELLDAAAGAPGLPASAIAVAADGACWVGTWGGGVWRLDGRRWTSYDFGREPRDQAFMMAGQLVSN